MKSAEIRSRFLDYFAQREHRVVRSSSLIPQGDATLLFANAGMNQFKDVFQGLETRDYSRAASSQKCVRAGGKHNDLDNVGYTTRHLTFFEMLGNFSFGDYFKKDAIGFAWELMTTGFGLPADLLHVTVFEEDDEAYQLWREEIGLGEDRLTRLGADDNFWAMGATGPCGPCSELHIDMEPDGPVARPGDEGMDDRFIELWNLVFMQFDKDAQGAVQPLPKPSIDTGMGLERISMVLQDKRNVFETDLLRPIIDRAAERAGTRYGEEPEQDVALRVIADHLRSSAFLLAEGSLPANDGRGYVQRRIIRRAARFGKRLGLEDPFLCELVEVLVEGMGEAYPELVEGRDRIEGVLRIEEERFQRTLQHAGKVFETIASGLEQRGEATISGEDAFRLKDTFGLPLDTLEDMAEVRGLGVDRDGFERKEVETRERDRASWKGGASTTPAEVYQQLAEGGAVDFCGYESEALGEVEIVALVRDQRGVAELNEGERGEAILARTPFYPEGGGQVGDHGSLRSADAFALVEDTRQPLGGLIVHDVSVRQGALRVGDLVEAQVDAGRRLPTALNHSATHLLHAALRAVLGEHVKQAGSLVAPDRLRFDFSHFAGLEPDELRRIAALVNRRIEVNDPVESEVVPIEEALARGAMAFFGDKYGDEVRTVRMGDFSLELCGGTHVVATGNIGYFAFTAESSVASGVRRVEAVTGETAVVRALDDRSVLEELAGRLHVPVGSLVAHVDGLQGDLKSARREIEELRLKLAAGTGGDGDGFREVAGVKLAVRRVEGLGASGMRSLADELRKKVGSGVVVLGTVGAKDKASILVSVTADLAPRVDAGKVVKELAAVVGGKGGGRPDMAQAGGPDGARLDEALARAEAVVAERLGAS